MAIGRSRPHYRVVFMVLVLGIGAYALLQSLVIPVLTVLIPALHTTQHTATWLMTAYLLSASVATPIVGRIGDKVGKERMLIATMVALTVGSLIAALTDSISVMIIARVIQGLGGGVLPLAFGIIRDEFPAKKLDGAVGLASALTAVGSGLGLIVAGPIVSHLGYHWLFWVPMIMTSVATVATILFVPESPVRSPGAINWLAALLLSSWLVALLLAVSQGPSWGWGSLPTLGLLVFAAICAAVWIWVELRSRTPLIDMRTMRIPSVWTTNLVATLAGVAMYGTMTFLPQLVQTPRALAGYGLSANTSGSGFYMLPLTVAMFLLSTCAGWLSARFGARQAVLAGSFVMIIPFIVLGLGHDRSWEIYLATCIFGVGLGCAFSCMTAIIVGAVPAAQTGAATGVNANVRTVGGAIGSAIAGSLLTSAGHTAHGFPADAGYTRMFWMMAAVMVLATVAALRIPRHRANGSALGQDIAADDRDVVGAGVAGSPESVVVAAGAAHVIHEDGGEQVRGRHSGVPAQDRPNDRGRTVSGWVRYETGVPVPRAVLTLIDPRGHQVARTIGGPEGDYRLDIPEPGNNVLIVSAAGHQPVAITLAGAGRQHLDITLVPTGELSGVIRHADTGAAVAQATITLTDVRGEVVTTATSTGEGDYHCRGLTPGGYTVVAAAARMRPTAITVTVPENGTLRQDIELASLAILAGSAWAGARAVPDAEVTVLDAVGEPVGTARTDQNGRYTVPDLPEGDYTVIARGYPPVTSRVTVLSGEIVHDTTLGYESGDSA